MEKVLSRLRHRLNDIMNLRSAQGLLSWDQEVYMPPGGAEARSGQLATLSALAHRLFTADETGALLDTLEHSLEDLSEEDRKLVEIVRYDYDRARALPESFVETFSREQSHAFESWKKAREASDFKLFAPHLEILTELLQEKATYWGYEDTPYDALLEEYEPGMRTAQVRAVFEELAPRQSALIHRIMDCGKEIDTSWLERDWPPEQQQAFTIKILQQMGFNMECGRQDVSPHPFTTAFDLYDVRVTTRFNRRDPFSGLMGSIHEGGHGLYCQGHQERDRGTPLLDGASLGMHESQSRMWENIIGHSLPFWRFCTPLMRTYFPDAMANVTPENIYEIINQVRPSLIRVEADECTYNLHIILRFEIELALLEGRIKVADVPELWNVKMKELLGVDVPDDAHGCLQDIHWAHGAMGYFPTYALGNLYAAQLFEKIQEAIPDLWEQVETGDFSSLLKWLRKHIHQYGRRKHALEILEDCTGHQLQSGPYLQYLENRYGALYGISHS